MIHKKFNLYFIIGIVIFLAAMMIYSGFKIFPGFVGAFIMYLFFEPVHRYLTEKKINKKFAAILVILISILIILIPFVVLSLLIFTNISGFISNWYQNPEIIRGILASIDGLIARYLPTFNIFYFLESNLSSIVSSVQGLLIKTFSGAGNFVINVFIMYFAFYFMLSEKESFAKMKEILPFNSKNSAILIKKFKEITYATVLVSGIIAVVQGFILSLTFFIFGIESWLFWGFITGILAFIPFIGQFIVWVPAVIIMLASGNYTATIGILVAGIILSNIDNVIRPYLQSKIGNIHPIITLTGVFIGVPLFGISGIILGPLIISYVFLTLKMLKEEHFD